MRLRSITLHQINRRLGTVAPLTSKTLPATLASPSTADVLGKGASGRELPLGPGPSVCCCADKLPEARHSRSDAQARATWRCGRGAILKRRFQGREEAIPR